MINEKPNDIIYTAFTQYSDFEEDILENGGVISSVMFSTVKEYEKFIFHLKINRRICN